MASSDVQICNLALALIGQRPITSLADGTQTSALCALWYDPAREATLNGAPWKEATKRAELAALTTAPEWEWDYQYQLPPDCLWVIEVSADDDIVTEDDWDIEGRTIVTDAGSPIYIKYVRNETDVTVFSPSLVDALTEKLAAEIVFGITKRADLRKMHLDVFARKLADARTLSSQQGTPPSAEANHLVNVRFGG